MRKNRRCDALIWLGYKYRRCTNNANVETPEGCFCSYHVKGMEDKRINPEDPLSVAGQDPFIARGDTRAEAVAKAFVEVFKK